jgi:hypothetical protein
MTFPRFSAIAALVLTATGAFAQSPAMLTTANLLEGTRTLPLEAVGETRLNETIHFAYAGSCLSGADVAAMKTSALKGEPVEVSTVATAKHKGRRADSRQFSGGVVLQSDAYDYKLKFEQTRPAADGSTDVTVSGWASGPANRYEFDEATKCNGWFPQMTKADIAPVTVHLPANGDSMVRIPILGVVTLVSRPL